MNERFLLRDGPAHEAKVCAWPNIPRQVVLRDNTIDREYFGLDSNQGSALLDNPHPHL